MLVLCDAGIVLDIVTSELKKKLEIVVFNCAWDLFHLSWTMRIHSCSLTGRTTIRDCRPPLMAPAVKKYGATPPWKKK